MNLKNFWAHLRLYDRLTFAYLWLTLLLVVFSPKPIPVRERIIVSHITVSFIIIFFIYWGQLRSKTHRHYVSPRWLRFLRDWHPLFWFTFLFFGEFTYLANLVFPYWIENSLIHFDLWLFGQPPHQFIETHASAWLVEFMAFAYWSYYPILLGVAGWYYLFRAENDAHPNAEKMTFIDITNKLCCTFYLCYILFMLMPARSPRHALNLNEHLNLNGGQFFNMIATLQNYVSVVGAAFPSSHVAVAWVAVMTLRDEYRLAFWSLMPLVIALTVSIFILQYHYMLDAVAGVILALVFEFFWRRYYQRHVTFISTNLQPSLATRRAANSLT